jgi:hypothetical protein
MQIFFFPIKISRHPRTQLHFCIYSTRGTSCPSRTMNLCTFCDTLDASEVETFVSVLNGGNFTAQLAE